MEKDKQTTGWRYYVGWPAYAGGVLLVMISTVPPEKAPWQYLLAGIILTLAGAALIFIRLMEDHSPLLPRIARILDYLGVILLVPGVLGFALVGYSAELLRGFGITAAVGVVLLLAGTAGKAISRRSRKSSPDK
jgi:peptidoglycan/LPS O-acetylase OafA/YrhL